MKPLFILLISIGLSLSSTAQKVNLSERQLDNMDRWLNTRYSGIDARSVTWRLNDKGFYEGSFMYDGHEISAQFDREGEWTRTSGPVELEDLPQEVRRVLSNDYPLDAITEIRFVEMPNRYDQYQVFIRDREPFWIDMSGQPTNSR